MTARYGECVKGVHFLVLVYLGTRRSFPSCGILLVWLLTGVLSVGSPMSRHQIFSVPVFISGNS